MFRSDYDETAVCEPSYEKKERGSFYDRDEPDNGIGRLRYMRQMREEASPRNLTAAEILLKLKEEVSLAESAQLIDEEIRVLENKETSAEPRVSLKERMLIAGDKEVARDMYGAIINAGLLAPSSILCGTVIEDGEIFNPYIHRTHLPLRVLTLLLDAVRNSGGQSLESYYRDLLVAHVMGYGYSWREPSKHLRAVNADGTFMSRAEFICRNELGRTVKTSKNTNGQRLRATMRAQFGYMKFLERETEVYKNMKEHNPRQLKIRYGIRVDQMKEVIQFFEDNPIRDLKALAFQLTAKMGEQPKAGNLYGADIYLHVGLLATAYSMKLFPARYSSFMLPTGGGTRGISDYFELPAADEIVGMTTSELLDLLCSGIERYYHANRSMLDAEARMRSSDVRW